MIEFKNVYMLYEGGHRPALNDVTLTIQKGDFVFLVGPSGSGKSTLIRLMLREKLPTKGSIVVAGQDLTKMHGWKVPYLRRNIGCVFQDFKLLPNKTVYENVAFALDVIGRPRHVIESQVPEVLRLVDLADKMNNYPDELSGGEQQRVSIARAFVNRPPLLLADEPTGNLDPNTSSGIMSLLSRINKTGTTVVVATHDREMVNNLKKRVIALALGKVVRDQLRGVYGDEDREEPFHIGEIQARQEAAKRQASEDAARASAGQETSAVSPSTASPSVPSTPDQPSTRAEEL